MKRDRLAEMRRNWRKADRVMTTTKVRQLTSPVAKRSFERVEWLLGRIGQEADVILEHEGLKVTRRRAP